MSVFGVDCSSRKKKVLAYSHALTDDIVDRVKRLTWIHIYKFFFLFGSIFVRCSYSVSLFVAIIFRLRILFFPSYSFDMHFMASSLTICTMAVCRYYCHICATFRSSSVRSFIRLFFINLEHTQQQQSPLPLLRTSMAAVL